jgi:hypothetical protein
MRQISGHGFSRLFLPHSTDIQFYRRICSEFDIHWRSAYWPADLGGIIYMRDVTALPRALSFSA